MDPYLKVRVGVGSSRDTVHARRETRVGAGGCRTPYWSAEWLETLCPRTISHASQRFDVLYRPRFVESTTVPNNSLHVLTRLQCVPPVLSRS